MAKRIWIYIGAGVVIAGLLVFGICQSDVRAQYEAQLQNVYARNFEQLSSDLSSVGVKLRKLRTVSSAAMQSGILSEVARQAGRVSASVSALPLPVTETQDFSAFVTRLDDYCTQLITKLSRGKMLTDGDYKAMEQLSAAAEAVRGNIDALRERGYSADLSMNGEAFYAQSDETSIASTEYPRLQYDGPFSESTEDKEPQGLSGSEVSAEEALSTARDFIGVGKVRSIAPAGENGGRIPTYIFEGSASYGAFSIEVTKTGGHILRFMVESGEYGSAVPTDARYEKLCSVARDFLYSRGLGEFRESYAQFYAGCAIINLAPVENDVTLYPDLIKVWVRVSDDSICGVDAYNYLMSHRKRILPSATIEPDAAAEELAVAGEYRGLALIPKDDNTEVLCHEFSASEGGQDYVLYINARSGEEEDVLAIVHTNEGVLTY